MELKYNSQTGNYEAPVDGGTLIVESDFFSESYPEDEPEKHPEAYSVQTWLNVENGAEVRIEQ